MEIKKINIDQTSIQFIDREWFSSSLSEALSDLGIDSDELTEYYENQISNLIWEKFKEQFSVPPLVT